MKVDPDPTKSGKDLFRLYTPKPIKELENPDYKNGGSLWGKLITELLDKPDERWAFQQFFGQPFTQLKSQTIAVLQGQPGCGKSQVLNVLAKTIANSVSLNLSAVGKYDLGLTLGAPVIVGDEVRGRFNETLFKQISGRSFITIERKWEDPFSYTPEGTLMCAWNNPPRIGEHSEAIEQRMAIFVCDGVAKRNTSDEIDSLDQRIADKEKNLVLDWALHGAVEVIKRGRVPTREELSARLRRVREEFGISTDPVRGFVKELDIKPAKPGVDTSSYYAKDDVYKVLCEWMKAEGKMPRAPMAKDVALKHVKRVIESMYGVGCMGHNLKVSAQRGGKKLRISALPIVFGQPVSILPISTSDVDRSVNDPDSYNEDEMPEGAKAIKDEREKKEEEARQNAEREKTMKEDDLKRHQEARKKQEQMRENARMAAQGYRQELDTFSGQMAWVKPIKAGDKT